MNEAHEDKPSSGSKRGAKKGVKIVHIPESPFKEIRNKRPDSASNGSDDRRCESFLKFFSSLPVGSDGTPTALTDCLMRVASDGNVQAGQVLLDKLEKRCGIQVPSYKERALFIAAENGHDAFLELLLSRGANVEGQERKRKDSCLMVAFKNGHVNVIKLLVKHVNQFPSDQVLFRYTSTIRDKELAYLCTQCIEIIVSARKSKADEANRNADSLLEEIEKEKKTKAKKKVAGAKRRGKKKKQEKEQKPTINNSLKPENESEQKDEEDYESKKNTAKITEPGRPGKQMVPPETKDETNHSDYQGVGPEKPLQPVDNSKALIVIGSNDYSPDILKGNNSLKPENESEQKDEEDYESKKNTAKITEPGRPGKQMVPAETKDEINHSDYQGVRPEKPVQPEDNSKALIAIGSNDYSPDILKGQSLTVSDKQTSRLQHSFHGETHAWESAKQSREAIHLNELNKERQIREKKDAARAKSYKEKKQKKNEKQEKETTIDNMRIDVDSVAQHKTSPGLSSQKTDQEENITWANRVKQKNVVSTSQQETTHELSSPKAEDENGYRKVINKKHERVESNGKDGYINYDEIEKCYSLDLHRLSEDQAIERVEKVLSSKELELQEDPLIYLIIITGIGKHSAGNVPILKPAVENYLGRNKYEFEEINKGGALRVKLKQK